MAARHRTVAPIAPSASRSGWGVRLLCVGLALLVGWGLYVGVQRGLSCRQSTVHPHRKALQTAVQSQLSVVQTLATGKDKPGWTLADGAKVIAADATLPRAVAAIQLSDSDRTAVTSYLVAVRTFDAALSTYMSKDDDASHTMYGSAAVSLQKAADNLSEAMASTPGRCRST